MKVREWRTIYHATGSQKKAGVSILISEKLELFFLHLFIFDRERQSTMGEGQREKETQNPKQAPGSELSAQSPM